MNINLTLIGQLIAFVAFVAFCMRYVWPPITGAMAARQNKIADGLCHAGDVVQRLQLASRLKHSEPSPSSGLRKVAVWF